MSPVSREGREKGGPACGSCFAHVRDHSFHPDPMSDRESSVTAAPTSDPVTSVSPAGTAQPGAATPASPPAEDTKPPKSHFRRPSIGLSDIVVQQYVSEVAKEIPLAKLRWDQDCTLGQSRVLDEDKVTRREASLKITPPLDLIAVTVWSMDVVGVEPLCPQNFFSIIAHVRVVYSGVVTLRTCALQ